MTREQLMELLTQRVRVWDAQHDRVFVEGEVIAVCFAPSIGVSDADGVIHWHTSELPIEVQKWERL